MKHLRKFKTKADRDAYMQQTPIPVYPYVYYIEDSRETEYSGLEVDIPLYIENITGTSVKFSNNYEYSRDGETWQSGTSSTVISFTESGERVYFRASGLTASSSSGIGSFSSTAGEFNIGGNIMSMVYGADYRGKTELTQTYTFYRMFYQLTRLKSAQFLALPSTTLTSYCYNGMFYGCTSLVNAPALPATTLVNSCYRYMFYGCTSLKTAPVLPAKSLQNNCYAYMFYGCTNLSYIKAMFTNTPSTTYTESWVKDVASTGQFVKNSAATWNVTGVNGIPEGWTVETADA